MDVGEKSTADPSGFVKPESSSPRDGSGRDHRAGEYTCPMHPEVRQATPGNCPKCGMALEPIISAPPAARTEYVCPMHPQIVRSEPGNCPICGMALEPRTISAQQEDNPELRDM